jgi:hypothetical protein
MNGDRIEYAAARGVARIMIQNAAVRIACRSVNSISSAFTFLLSLLVVVTA